jgi:N-acetylmuramoyl-L-alanine amidase
MQKITAPPVTVPREGGGDTSGILLALFTAIALAIVALPPPPPAIAAAGQATATSAGRVIAVDPGHGGFESGAVYHEAGGRVELIERDVNLAIALFLADELRNAGYEPVLTRTTDSQVNLPPTDRNGDGRIDNDDDLQARVDVANDAQGSLLLSVHNNGSTNPRTRGTSTWYALAHPQGVQSRALAQLVQAELLAGLRAAGYADPVDQGANDDPPLLKPYGHLFLVGPQTPRVARVSEMPGIVGESLYVTSDVESRLLATEEIQRAIAAAYRRGVDAYFAQQAE